MRTMFATGKAAADFGIGVKTPQRWNRQARLKAERTGTGRRVYCKAALEDLNVCGMSKNRALAGSVLNGGWHEICRQLQYKAAMRGGSIAIADRFFPSSKTCSDCGCVKHSMPLSVGFWSCGDCAMVHERDPKGRQKSSTVRPG
jgi:putative transposase